MKIKKIKFENYRNIDGIEIAFAEDCNFIVGENNLGKSNLLNALNTLFSYRGFKFEDFKDKSNKIEIVFQLKLSDLELGHFEDLFDVEDYSLIDIRAIQKTADDNLDFYHVDSDTYIQASLIKSLNFVYYDSLRNPFHEINFDKGKGVGKFLKNIISRHLQQPGVSGTGFLDSSKTNLLISDVNGRLSRIKSFQEYGISATLDDDIENMLSKIILLTDAKNESFYRTGYGIQFVTLIILSILDKIEVIKSQRGDRGIFEDSSTHEKSISLVIGLDEPEIHLHPYMQRSLIKYLNSIITNQDSGFQQLVKELFDIDSFNGQIIIVTHSPNILLNDFRQIVRFYSEAGLTRVVSGSLQTLDEQNHRHLYLHFPFIKEAFFSRCAIFVEGDSEFSSFPLFAETLEINFDDLGICVIQSGGDAIVQLIELAQKFSLECVGVSDKDDGATAPLHTNHFYTRLRDFESEIISLIDVGKESILRGILQAYDSQGENRAMTDKALNKKAHKKYGIVATPYSTELKLADIALTNSTDLKSYYITWFGINKCYALGLLIGSALDAAEIPMVYQSLIQEAKVRAQNV